MNFPESLNVSPHHQAASNALPEREDRKHATKRVDVFLHTNRETDTAGLLTKRAGENRPLLAFNTLASTHVSPIADKAPSGRSPVTQTQSVSSIPIVDRKTSEVKSKTAVFNIRGSEKHKITPAKFLKAILTDQYATTETFMGVPIMEKAVWLGWQDDAHIMYQQTGGNFLVSPRAYMLALKKDEGSTESKVRVSWRLLDNYNPKTERFTGPFAHKLEQQRMAPPKDFIWTPYSEGYWELDLKALTITYHIELDVGGSLPFSPDAATVIFPDHLANKVFGLTGEFEVQ
ncbi:MAG: hypothetical protein HQM16_11950 [Deltaproteobacteria bacterium]|nr:hypothetical protein [Deltaproteobacteria bacterium]